ncbi:MAG TPA: hypothetical protein VFJ58_27315 [Armatimonadota bacterium]|nr:hypothetical protein [Armatimonadota bacterium]
MSVPLKRTDEFDGALPQGLSEWLSEPPSQETGHSHWLARRAGLIADQGVINVE